MLQVGNKVYQEMVDRPMPGVYEVALVLEQMVNALDDIPFSMHNLVPQWHQLVLHVASDSIHQMYPVGKERIEQVGEMYPISKESPVYSHTEHRPDLRGLVTHIGSCKTEHDNLSSVIADEVEFEAMTPFHCPLPSSSKAGEHLVGISAQVAAYGYHGRVYKCDAYASPDRVEVQEEQHLEERPALQFHEVFVGHRIREITLEVNPNEMQVVVLEIVESAKVRHDQNRHNLAVGHSGCTSAASLAL